MSSQYVKVPVEDSGAPGSVDSFNGRSGIVVSQSGDYTASQISNIPHGSVSATDVQAAINELADESASSTLTNTHILVGNVSNVATDVAMSGDATIANTGAVTIAVGAVTDAKASLSVKPAVSVVATSNVALTGAQTIDGQLTVAGTSIVLATAQTSGAENGPWVVQSGAWTRPAWYPSGGTSQAFQFITANVRLGTTYQGGWWRQTAVAPIIIDTTPTTWTVIPKALNSSTVANTIPLNIGGTGGATAPAARVSLNIDQRSTFSNADYAVLSTDRYVAQIGTMSAPRTVTLPAANSVNAGQGLKIVDESGSVTSTNLITVAAAGSDTIDGSASKVIRAAYGEADLISNGSNMWFRPVTGIGAGGTGLNTTPVDGQLLIGSSATSAYGLATLTAGNGITITNAANSITVASNGSGTLTTVTKTSNYTILTTDDVIFCDTTGGAFALTLPTPANGLFFRIIDSGGVFGTNNLTLTRHGSEKIQLVAASKILQTNSGWFNVVSNGTDWFVG